MLEAAWKTHLQAELGAKKCSVCQFKCLTSIRIIISEKVFNRKEDKSRFEMCSYRISWNAAGGGFTLGEKVSGWKTCFKWAKHESYQWISRAVFTRMGLRKSKLSRKCSSAWLSQAGRPWQIFSWTIADTCLSEIVTNSSRLCLPPFLGHMSLRWTPNPPRRTWDRNRGQRGISLSSGFASYSLTLIFWN